MDTDTLLHIIQDTYDKLNLIHRATTHLKDANRKKDQLEINYLSNLIDSFVTDIKKNTKEMENRIQD